MNIETGKVKVIIKSCVGKSLQETSEVLHSSFNDKIKRQYLNRTMSSFSFDGIHKTPIGDWTKLSFDGQSIRISLDANLCIKGDE